VSYGVNVRIAVVCRATTSPEVPNAMTWDKESRMLTNSLANASYVYNGFDARVSKTVSSTTTTFKRAGADPVSPVLSDVAGSTTTNYLPGISSRAGSTSTFTHSGIKNGILQTNSSQSNIATKRYDAFGDDPTTTGTWQTRFDYGGGFGYQRDDESGYKLLGHRYYDPEIGPFLTRDPIKDGRNWYAYCASNPVINADPEGERLLRLLWTVIWELPQAAAGALGSIGGKMNTAQSTPNSFVIENSWLAKLTQHTITLGPFILTGQYGISEATLAHERVHRDQSRRLGWGYLPAHIVGYVGGIFESLSRGRGWEGTHDASLMEQEADLLSGSYKNYKGNPFLRERFHDYE